MTNGSLSLSEKLKSKPVSRKLEEITSSLAIVVITVVIVGLLLLILGKNPVIVFQSLIVGAVGSLQGIAETIARTNTYLLAGIAVAIAFHARTFNIGIDGQIYTGAALATITALAIGGLNLPGIIAIPVVYAGGFIGGAVWGSIAGVLKARFKANEIITTIMLNYIAIFLIDFLVSGPLKVPGGPPQSADIPLAARLPVLIASTRLHAGIFIGIICIIVAYFIIRRTVFGYEIRCIGHNEEAAKFAGINLKTSILKVMIVSGGIAGMAGADLIMGIHHKLYNNISSGFGYTAIAVALLGGLKPVWIALAAVLFASLEIGSSAMQYRAGIPSYTAWFIEGVIILMYLSRPWIKHLIAKLVKGVVKD